eukprot:scaffold598_cov318-Pavlova_lutheri.AAC.20
MVALAITSANVPPYPGGSCFGASHLCTFLSFPSSRFASAATFPCLPFPLLLLHLLRATRAFPSIAVAIATAIRRPRVRRHVLVSPLRPPEKKLPFLYPPFEKKLPLLLPPPPRRGGDPGGVPLPLPRPCLVDRDRERGRSRARARGRQRERG